MILAALAAMALVGTALVWAPAASATKSPQPRIFTVFLSFADWETYPSGARGGIGDLSVFTGAVSTSYQGSRAGDYTITARVIDRDGSGRKAVDLRDLRIQVELSGGAVWAEGVVEDPAEKPPTGLHILPVIGGTGDYATARGTVIIRSLGNSGEYSLAYDVFVDPSLSRERAKLGPATVEAVGSGAAGDNLDYSDAQPGDVLVTTRSGGGVDAVITSTVIARTRTTSATTVTYEHEMVVIKDGGIALARGSTTQRAGQVPAATKASFTILGGTGDYQSRRGEVRFVPGRSGAMDLRMQWGPQAAGKNAKRGWFEQSKSPMTIDTATGGELALDSGRMSDRPTKGTELGDYAGWARAIASDMADSGGWITSSMEANFTQGTMMLAGFAPINAETRTWIVLGGTGDFGGASGVATGVVESRTWKMKAAYRQ